MSKKKFTLANSKVIKNLEKALCDFKRPDCSQLKTLPFFVCQENCQEIRKTQEILATVHASDISIALLKKYEAIVTDATLAFSSDNKIRIIDDANNLIIMQGAIRQPFKDKSDIFCQLLVNHKTVLPNEDVYRKIISNLKGDCLILK